MCGGSAALLVPYNLSCIERAWQERKLITAVLMEMCMIVCIYTPHRGRENEEYFQFMDELMMILNERKQLGAKRFFIAGDGFSVEIGMEDH